MAERERKASKAEKTVLSRQEIATRKRALQAKKMQVGGAGQRALIGVFLGTASLLALLSVATFDVKDRTGPGYRNLVGPMGHLIAESLRGVFGICGYLLPLGGIYAAVILFVGNRERRRWPQIVALCLLALSGAVLAQIFFAGNPGWAHPPGGAIGKGLASILVGMFSTVGTVILVTAVCVAAFIVGTQYTFLKLCALAWAGACVLGKRVQEGAVAWFEQQKVAYKERQERAAQEKLEEEAFLAQLEEDEAELLEAERAAEEAEAAEAEAMAEEAVRLAREEEKERAATAKKPSKETRETERATAREKKPAETPTPALPATTAAQRPAPGADPAWVSFLAPMPNTAAGAAPATAEPRPVASVSARVRTSSPRPWPPHSRRAPLRSPPPSPLPR
jgi:S-DNA-T family DNA segregation ATPase FtsK/SpoIIIE